MLRGNGKERLSVTSQLLGGVVRVDRLHHHAFDLRHGEDAFHQREKLDFAQHLYQRGRALDSRSAGDQAVRSRFL